MSDSNNMYQIGTAKILKIGITGNDELENFRDLLSENILDTAKICQAFVVQTNIINNDNYKDNNLIFYVTELSKLMEDETINGIKNIASNIYHPKCHLFIVIDGCNNLEVDDDGDLVFTEKKYNDLFRKFKDAISLVDEKIFDVCRISVEMSRIWKKIVDDSSIVNLNEEQINKLATKILKKVTKLEMADKKREIKTAIKKINISDKLAETGYSLLYELISQSFKLVNQKKIVCQNYLYEFTKASISLDDKDMGNINILLKEIYEINYLKTEMHDDLTDKIDTILVSKLKQFYERSRNNVVINTNTLNQVDAYQYQKFLVGFIDIAKGYNMSNIMEITEQEIGAINKLIIDHHNKEMEKVTDIDKIISVLEIFANKDKNNLLGLFEKIRKHPNIIRENISRSDKWIDFINKCLKFGIPKDSVVNLIEDIIMMKVSFYNDTTKTNSSDILLLYPQCLFVFLLSNINKHFVFKKLFMYTSYSIRYSGKNMSELIKNIRQDSFETMLTLEYKLLHLCHNNVEEASQPINLSDVDIVETFNEQKAESRNLNKNSKSKQIKHNKKLIDDDVNDDINDEETEPKKSKKIIESPEKSLQPKSIKKIVTEEIKKKSTEKKSIDKKNNEKKSKN